MSLRKRIEDALVLALGLPDEPTAEQGGRGKIPTVAAEISDAIIEFLQEQTFTITEMKAPLEVEDIDTAGPLQASVLPTVTTTVSTTVATSGGPGTGVGTGFVSMGTNGVTIPPLILRKTPKPGEVPQGGVMTSFGHAYIGRNPIQADGSEDTTKVKLLKIKPGTE